MKSTDDLSGLSPLQNLLDRPIAFHRCFVRLGIGITGAVMLSQAVYWSKRTSDSEGWFHKSIEEWEEETGLTRFEQETAKRNLKGILEIERRGIPARLYFRIDWNCLEKSFINHSLLKTSNQDCGNPANKNGGTPQTRLRKPRKLDCGNPANKISGKQQTGLLDSSNLYKEEITSEITSEITAETTIPPTPQSPTSQGESTDRLSERGEKSPISGTRDNPKEAEKQFAKGDGSPSRQNTPPDEILLPDWLRPEDWKDFLSFRREIKAPMNAVAQRRAIIQLEQLRNEGQDPSQVINQSIVNGWRGLFSVKDRFHRRDSPPKTFEQIKAERTHEAAKRVLDEIYGPQTPEDFHGTISI
jgi:hypothetical protein